MKWPGFINILKESSSKFTEKLDLIVSNPPYVLNSEKELMLSNVLDYEPHLALYPSVNLNTNYDPLIFYNQKYFFLMCMQKIFSMCIHLDFQVDVVYAVDFDYGPKLRRMCLSMTWA